MFIKFDFIRYFFLTLYLIFLFLLLFNILSPNEAFAMEPSDHWITNYYEGKEYVGPDPYKYFHPDSAPNIDTIQSKVSKPYGPIIEDNWYEINGPQTKQSTRSINELASNPLYELDGKPIYRSINPSYDRDELHFWTHGQSIRGDIPVSYYFEPKHATTFELDSGSIEGTISTDVDSVTWHRRNHNNMEIIRDYCNYVDNFSKNKKGILTKISLCIKTTSNNITFICIKCNEIGKRKIIWTIWERNKSKYDSYKEFKRSWDSNTSIWSSIKKDIREDTKAEVEDLLGIRNIKKDIRKSVREEVEKLLRERQPFKC
jgi:hypothetical protein